MPKKILLVGMPRSGTTWVANILGASPHSELIVEPDNEKTSLLAFILKRGVPRFPVLEREDQPSPSYELLWRLAFEGRNARVLSRSILTKAVLAWNEKRSEKLISQERGTPPLSGETFLRLLAAPSGRLRKQVRIIKSVHAVLCLDWIVGRFRPDITIVTSRNPLGTLASWRRLNMPDATRVASAAREYVRNKIDADYSGAASCVDPQFADMALQLGYMYNSIRLAIGKHPEFIEVSHEYLCESPEKRFRELFDICGLPWDAFAERKLRDSNRAGSGYKPVRDAQAEIGKWKKQLSECEMEYAVRFFSALGIHV